MVAVIVTMNGQKSILKEIMLRNSATPTVRTIREVRDTLNTIEDDINIRAQLGQYIADCLNAQ